MNGTAVKKHILNVLASAPRRKAPPRDRGFLSAYQIFALLPEHVRTHLIVRFGQPGKGNADETRATAVSAISRTLARSHRHVEKAMADLRGLRMIIDGQEIEAGNGYGFNLYRLRD